MLGFCLFTYCVYEQDARTSGYRDYTFTISYQIIPQYITVLFDLSMAKPLE